MRSGAGATGSDAFGADAFGADAFAAERRRMVARQLVPRGITDERVLDAMLEVPRHLFVPADIAGFAYSDGPLPIADGQTISQPYIVALMLQYALLSPDAVVLDIGTGSGYAAAVASRLAARVVSIERHPGLAASARQTLGALGYPVEVITGDGMRGWPEAAPYDAVLAAATGPSIPPAWLEQLRVGGRLVMPIGRSDGPQSLIVRTKTGDGSVAEENLGAVAFVPLLEGVADEGGPPAGEE
jgi:protein-L-isoaspartate(D-aspartate) O-methyltransferase